MLIIQYVFSHITLDLSQEKILSHVNAHLFFRIYSNSFTANSLSLVFTNISENDAGEYTCNGTVNGTPQSATVSVMVNMPLIVTNEMAPPIQKVQEGKKGFIKCTGPGGFIVSWIRNGNQIKQGMQLKTINIILKWIKLSYFVKRKISVTILL